MAVTTKGYQGTISDVDMATQLALLPPHVYSPTDLTISQNGTTRQINVATGTAWANFVRAIFDTATPLTLTPPASGGEWWAIVVTRQWSPTSTAIIEAIDTGVATDGTVPKLIPKAVYTTTAGAAFWRKNPGTAGTAPSGSHQILGFVHVRAADTTLTIFDCRIVRGALGLSVPTLTALAASIALGFLTNATLVTVGTYATPYGQTHERSVWMLRSDGAAYPLGRIVVAGRSPGADALEELRALQAAGILSIQAGETTAANSVNLGENYVYTGTDWVLDPRNSAQSQLVTGDANNLLSNGSYRGTDLTNGPIAGFVYYRVQRHDDSFVAQDAFGYGGRHFYRTRSSGTWGSWAEVASLAAPTFTGAVASSTPNQNESNTRIATTGWVQTNSGIRVNTFQQLYDLQASAQRPPVGSLISWGASTDNGMNHYFSLWRVNTDGRFIPVAGVPMLMADYASLANLAAQYNAGWNSRIALDHKKTSAQPSERGQLEYRWDANRNGFRVWPGANAYSQFSYQGSSDQPLGNNAYTTCQFDTVEVDNLFADYLGTSAGSPRTSYRLNDGSRYDLFFRFAVTNGDSNPYSSTIYDESGGYDSFQQHGPMYFNEVAQLNHSAWRSFGQNATVRCAVYKSGTTANWIRRGVGSNQFVSNRPTLTIRLIGWDG